MDNGRHTLVMLGAGGHAKVVQELLTANNMSLGGIIDPELDRTGVKIWRGIPVLGSDEVLLSMDTQQFLLVNGIGHLPRSVSRRQIYLKARELGFRFPALIHPSAWISSGVVMKDGAQIMAGVVIQPDSHIGENTLINTGVTVDHDCVIGDHTHIAPGATLCGDVSIGNGGFVGSGSTIIQGIQLGDDSLIRAGAVVVKNPSTQVTSNSGP
jgi:sugar O-acyltransferase (sialic acid O-acetyltransferase NeuD family)